MMPLLFAPLPLTLATVHFVHYHSLASLQNHSIRRLLYHRNVLGQAIGISHDGEHILPCPRERLPHLLVLLLPRRVLPDDLARSKLDKHPRIPYPDENVVQPHEEAREQQEPRRHDADLAREHGDAVVSELVLVEHDVFEELDGVGALQEGERDRGIGGLQRGLGGGRALVVGAVGPVEGLDDLLDVFELFLPGGIRRGESESRARGSPVLLPLFGVGHFEHGVARLVYPVERVEGVELDEPAAGRMLDAHEVVAEDHFGRSDSQVLGHFLDGAGLEDRELARDDFEAIPGMGRVRVPGGGGVDGGAIECRHTLRL